LAVLIFELELVFGSVLTLLPAVATVLWIAYTLLTRNHQQTA